MKIRNNNIAVVLLALMMSLQLNAQSSRLESTHYDKKANTTILTMIPQGSVVLPGKWKKTSYNSSSRQHFFTDNKSTTIAVVKADKDKYPFYTPTLTDDEFVTEFYKWDAGYMEQQGVTVTLLNDQAAQGYIVWQAKTEASNSNSFFLFGSKNEKVYNFLCTSTKWTDTEITDFLVGLFERN